MSYMNTGGRTFTDLMILRQSGNPNFEGCKGEPACFIFELFANPAKSHQLEQIRNQTDENIQRKWDFVDAMLKNPNNTDFLYEMLWNIGADPCLSLIKYCKFQGKPCRTLFQMMPTTLGPCCTFNMDKFLYKESPFENVIALNINVFDSV